MGEQKSALPTWTASIMMIRSIPWWYEPVKFKVRNKQTGEMLNRHSKIWYTFPVALWSLANRATHTWHTQTIVKCEWWCHAAASFPSQEQQLLSDNANTSAKLDNICHSCPIHTSHTKRIEYDPFNVSTNLATPCLLDMFIFLTHLLVSNWILTSCQPHRVTSGYSCSYTYYANPFLSNQ